MSPRNLLSTTLGDELKMATGGAGKVVSLSLKDRAAILLGGRLADDVFWFDDTSGNWISSTWYCRQGKLADWLSEYASRNRPDQYFGAVWNLSVPETQLQRLWRTSPTVSLPILYGLGSSFPHTVNGGLKSPGPVFYKAFTACPFGNEYVLQTAREAIRARALGHDDVPDLLAINLSSNDYIGHIFGPNSAEILDVTVRTDRLLSDFFDFLRKNVPGGLERVTIALTSDHGVAPMPEEMTANGFSAGRIAANDLAQIAEAALTSRFGPHEWGARFVDPYLYLREESLKAVGDAESVRIEAARAIQNTQGIYMAFPREQIEQGRLGQMDIASHIYKAFHPKRAGDVLVITDPYWFTEESPLKHNTTHGSPYPYDTHVPLMLAGCGIAKGLYRNPVCPGDIAPTLCDLLGIGLPTSCDGQCLIQALQPAVSIARDELPNDALSGSRCASQHPFRIDDLCSDCGRSEGNWRMKLQVGFGDPSEIHCLSRQGRSDIHIHGLGQDARIGHGSAHG